MSFDGAKAIPVLRIFDVVKAREFYLDFLGFTLDWDHGADAGLPRYMQVSRGDLRLHLSEHHGDACPGACVLIETGEVVALQEELKARQYKYMNPGVRQMPWGAQEVVVIDPFGNRLRFSETLSG